MISAAIKSRFQCQHKISPQGSRTGQRPQIGFISFLGHSFTRLYSHGFVLPDTTATVSFTRYDSQTPKPEFLLPDATATVLYHQRSKPRLYITSHHHHGFVHQATHSCFHSLDIKATVSYHQTPQPWFHSRHGFIHQIRQSWFHSCHRIIRQTPQPRYHSPGTTAMI